MTESSKANLPAPTAAHRRLEVFIGGWHAEGTSYDEGQDAADPRAPGVPWTSDESYEWLPGKFFVLHRWDAMTGEHEFRLSILPRSTRYDVFLGPLVGGGYEKKIMNAAFRIGETRLVADEGMGTKVNGITLPIEVADDAVAKRVFTTLCEGGNVLP